MLRTYRFALILFILPLLVWAQSPEVIGGYRLFHVSEGRVFEQGRLVLHTNMNFFTGVRPAYPDGGGGTIPAKNLWANNGNLGFSYGILPHFDTSLLLKLYRDNNGGIKESSTPASADLIFRLGGYELSGGRFRAGFSSNFRFGFDDVNDVVFELYDPGTFQFGLGTAFSYYSDPYLPTRSFSTHLNLGYWLFNDVGAKVRGGNVTNNTGSSALLYGLGFNYPVDAFDLALEIWGSSYSTPPDSFAHAVEDYMYVTPGFKYYPLSWLTVNFAVDLLVVGSEEETLPPPGGNVTSDISNYSSWKVQLGLDFKLAPLAQGTSATEIQRQQFEDRLDFFEDVMEERREAESIEDELEKLKRQRRQAEKELEELRELLEEQENK
jgi:hypothetical protein